MADMNTEREFGWEDEITNDSTGFTLLPQGDYHFRVISVERGRHAPSPTGKLPACNKAELTIELSDGVQKVQVKHNLYLHSRCEGLLCEFFTSIGQRKHGEALRMNWNAVTGSQGRCKVEIRSWTNTRNGETMQSNEIKRFYEPDAAAKQPAQTTFTAGAF